MKELADRNSVFYRLTRTCRQGIVFLVIGYGAGVSALASDMHVGTNLSGVKDYGAMVFTDVFKQARPWLTASNAISVWNTKESERIPLDANGWPTGAPFSGSDGNMHYPFTVFDRNAKSPLPIGIWTLVVEGSGELRHNMDGTWRTIRLTGGQQVFQLNRTRGEQFLVIQIRESDPDGTGDYIRNIRLVAPGFYDASNAPDFTTETFNPEWYAHIDDFQNLRFMDWGETNNSDIVSWSDRVTPESFTNGSHDGVAAEYWVELANLLSKDIWVCIPHLADESYVRGLAKLIDDNLNSDLRVYVEYSNEIWNPQFTQTPFATNYGLQMWPGENISHLNYAYAERAAWVWDLFMQEFADDARVIKTLAGQAQNSWHLTKRLEALQSSISPAVNPKGLEADVIAIAPYLTFNSLAATELWNTGDFNGGEDGHPVVHRVTWNGPWQVSGTSAPEVSNRQVYIRQDGAIVRSADLSASTSGRASFFFDWSTSGLEAGDSVEAQINDGTGWVTIFRADHTQTNGGMRREFFTPLPAETRMVTDFKVRFRINGNDSDDTFIIDGIHLNVLPTVDFLLDELMVDEVQVSELDNVRRHVELADAFGATVVCYEGGQHLTALRSSNQDRALLQILDDAQRDLRMRQRYLEYLTMMNHEGVAVFSHFSDVGVNGPHGSWGMMESIYDTRETAPKYDALMTWIESNPASEATLPVGSGYGAAEDGVPPPVIEPEPLPEPEPVTGNLEAVVSGRTVELSWPAYGGAGNLTNYRIQRDGVVVNWWVTVDQFTEEVPADGIYQYTVIAWDNAAKEALDSFTATVTVVVEAVAEPDAFVVDVQVSGSAVALDWSDYTGPGELTNFRIKRDGVVINWWVTVSDYVDATLPSGAYEYTIIAWDNAVKQELDSWTVEVVVENGAATEPEEPAPSTELLITVTDTGIELDWPDYAGDGHFTNYRIKRDGLVIEWWAINSEFQDVLKDGREVSYTVIAWDNLRRIELERWTATAVLEEYADRPFGMFFDMPMLLDDLQVSLDGNEVSLDWRNYEGPGVMTSYQLLRDDEGIASDLTSTGYTDTLPGAGEYVYTVLVWDGANSRELDRWNVRVQLLEQAFEGEALELTNYRLESGEFASGGSWIRVNDRSQLASASLEWGGIDGLYSILVGLFDEDDGDSHYTLRLNGEAVADWTSDMNPGGAGATAETLVEIEVRGLELKKGDVVTLEVMVGGFDNGRVDYIRIYQ